MARAMVTINPKDGTMKVELDGIVGTGCDALTRVIRERNEEVEYKQTAAYCEEQERPDYVEDHSAED